VRLPPYRPDSNADEPIWTWVRQDVTANRCLGSTAACFASLPARATDVLARRRTARHAEVARAAQG
jgi:hypothetical protein